MKIRIIIVGLSFCLPYFGFTQISDSIAVVEPISESLENNPASDTSFQENTKRKKNKERFMYRLWKKDYPNPKKALYLSLAVPGAGQIYNKRWWKLPFVYGAVGGLIYWADYNTSGYKLFRDAYIAELNGNIHPFTGSGADAGDLKRFRDKFDKDRQLSYILIGVVHLLQGAEAFVDAHLRNFDVDDDLSFRLKPSIQDTPYYGPVVGLGISFSFEKRKEIPKVFLIQP